MTSFLTRPPFCSRLWTTCVWRALCIEQKFKRNWNLPFGIGIDVRRARLTANPAHPRIVRRRVHHVKYVRTATYQHRPQDLPTSKWPIRTTVQKTSLNTSWKPHLECADNQSSRYPDPRLISFARQQIDDDDYGKPFTTQASIEVPSPVSFSIPARRVSKNPFQNSAGAMLLTSLFLPHWGFDQRGRDAKDDFG